MKIFPNTPECAKQLAKPAFQTLAVTLICLLLSFNSIAQPQNWNWFFGYGAAVNFHTGSPVSLAGCAMSTTEGNATISGPNGDLLFYTDGIKVWNRNNVPMPNGTGLNGDPSSTQSAVIIPHPDSPNVYFIFTAACCGNTAGLNYSEVDTTLNGGLGNVTVKNVPLIHPIAEKLCAVRHCNGLDYWIIVHGYMDGDSIFYAYLVSQAGVAAPVLSHVGCTSNSFIGYLKASPNGQRLAAANAYGVDSVQIYDFNNSNGVVSNPISISSTANSGPYGISFSPNNNVLYYDAEITGALFQFDLTSNNQATINASRYTIATLNIDTYMGLQMGIDNKLYISHYNQASLDVINSPNTLGVGCNLVNAAVPLVSGTCGLGLPNLVDAIITTPPHAGLPTDTVVCTPTVTLTADSGATSYLWNTGATTRSIIADSTAIYVVTVTGITICSTNIQIDTINVTILPNVTVNLGADTTLCLGQNLTLNAGNAGAIFHWSTGATTQTIITDSTANYSVTVTAGSCVVSDTIDVTFNPAPVVNLGNDTTLCSNQTITLDAGNAGASYHWNTNATTETIVPTVTGTYAVTITIGTCVDSGSIHVTMIPAIVVNLGPDTILCQGQSLTLNAGNAGATYLWSTGATTEAITVSASAQYFVTVTGGTCSAIDSITVTFNPAPTVNLGPPIIACIGTPETIDAGNAGASFLWSNGSTTETINPITSGNYSVTVSIGNCPVVGTIAVTFQSLPIINLPPVVSLCTGQTSTLDAGNAGATYSWSTGATTESIIVNSSGVYNVEVNNGTCSASDTVTVTYFTAPVVDLGQNIYLCYGESATIDAGNIGFDFFWSNGQTTEQITANVTAEYKVKVSNHGCSTWDSILVTIEGKLPLFLGNDTFICPGDQIQINATKGYSDYSWSPVSGGGDLIIIYQPGTYFCTVIDTVGCTTSSSILIQEFCMPQIYIPNSFTPNGNGWNDIFMAYGDGIQNFHMYIFDRWGELIFQSNDIAVGWDGTYQTNNCPQGVFIYKIEYQIYDYLELKSMSAVGNVNLIR